MHLTEQAQAASKQLAEMNQKQDEAFGRMETGHRKDDLSLIAYAASTLQGLCDVMEREAPLWEDHQLADLQPHVERAKQEVTQSFSDWLKHQTPRIDTPEAVGEDKHRMLNQLGGSL